jgi:hypothetical protein
MLEKKLGNLKPAYLERFDEFVKFHSQHGGGAEGDKYRLAKTFSSAYEIYIYAYFVGLHKDHRLEVAEGDKTRDFWDISNWRPGDLVDCLLASAIAESNLPLADADHMEERELNGLVKEVKKTIEAFANGGLNYLDGYFSEDPEALYDDNIFIALLQS